MISQKCPKCLSKRVRRGYRPTPLWSKILFRYHLLCDNCNWEFTGFAVPGTVSAKPTRNPKKTTTGKLNAILEDKSLNNSLENLQDASDDGVVSLDNLAAEQNVRVRKKTQQQ